MIRKSFYALMVGVFAALLAITLFVERLPDIFSSVMAFPFEQLGAGLRALSLIGAIGNGLALALCTAISLIPVTLALKNRGVKGSLLEKIALCCTSVIVFISLFIMANPAAFLSNLPYSTEEFLPIVKGSMGCMAWSFIIFCLVLRLIRWFRTGDTKVLSFYLKIALYVLCLLFVAVIVLSCVRSLLQDLSSVQQSFDGVMAVLRFIASSLPYVLDIVITFSMITLLEATLAKDEENTVKTANILSKQCCLALGLTAGLTAVLNGLQLLFAPSLSDISVNVELPVVSLVFTLLILLLARFVVENRKLQNDNDLFI